MKNLHVCKFLESPPFVLKSNFYIYESPACINFSNVHNCFLQRPSELEKYEKFSDCIKLQLFALCITNRITTSMTFQHPNFFHIIFHYKLLYSFPFFLITFFLSSLLIQVISHFISIKWGKYIYNFFKK